MGKAVDSKAVEVVETAQPKWGYIFVEEIEGLTGERCPRFFGLRQEEQQFVLHLITGHKRFNITAAYRAAYEPDEDAARDRVSGYRLMQKSGVRQAVREVMGILGVGREWVMFQIARYAAGIDVADLEPYLTGDKTLKELRRAGVNTRAIKKARRTVEKDGSRHYLVEVTDPLPALHELVRVLGMATDQVDVKMTSEVDFGKLSEEELRRLEHATAARLVQKKAAEVGAGDDGAVNALTRTTEPAW